MCNLKAIIIASAAALCSVGAVAQEDSSIEGGYLAESQELGYKPYPYNFIQVQGGFGTTFTDVSCWKLLSPTFSVGVGRMFSPIIGARVHVNGWKAKGGFDEFRYTGDQPVNNPSVLKYKHSYINSNVDLMVNIFNIFSQKVHRPFDLYLIGGLGLNYTWHNKQFESIVSQYQVGSNIINAWGADQNLRHNVLSHNLRLGLLADYNIAKHWSVGAEIDFNSLDDRFNSKYKDADDWMMTGQLSITYKFGFKDAPAPKPIAVAATPVYQETKQAETVPTPAPKPVVVEEPIKETIFYALRESDPGRETIINKVAEWCKKYPNKTITIDGYADKGTGNPKINAGYAQQRADKVAAALKSKGVPASQMTVKSYGDTVQPFPENDKNRCVIIEGK
ncbi:MAG: OmpA family protein [Bacteroidaceae bacterium]|nr:OmpA family protein [Bacteroidaceae bacterium]